MGLLNKVKVQKNPAIRAGDYISYQSGGSNPIQSTYKTYLSSVASLNNAINIVSNLASGASLNIYKKVGKKKNKITLAQMDEWKANDIDTYNGFIRKAMSALISYGATYIIPEESTAPERKGKMDFFIMDNNKMTIEAPKDGRTSIDYYEYTSAMGTKTKYDRSQVIYCPLITDVTNQLYAIPKVKALNDMLLMATSATNFAVNFTQQGGKKSFIVGYDDIMSDEQQKEIKSGIDKFLANQKATGLMLNTEKLSVSTVSDGLNSIQLIETLTWINNEILKMFQIPLLLTGDYKDVSGDQATTRLMISTFFYSTIDPIFKDLAKHFSTYFRDSLGMKNVEVVFEYDGIHLLETGKIELLERFESAFKLGTVSVNEYREKLELDAINAEYADYHTLPQYMFGSQALFYETYDGTNPTQSESILPSGTGGENNTQGANGAI